MRFLTDESGAVTGDWVILTAAITGVGVAVGASVAVGTNSLAESVRAALSGSGMASLVQGTLKTLVSMSFEDGNFEGWSTTRTGFSDHFGQFLGNFAGSDPPVTYDVTLPDGTKEARITFDLLVLDSWDADSAQWSRGRGDGMAVMVNGQEVAFELFAHGTTTASDQWGFTREGTVAIGDATYHTTMTLADQGRYFGTQWPDQVWRVEIAATNPPAGGFTLGMDANTDQGRSDESYGINNFSVSAR